MNKYHFLNVILAQSPYIDHAVVFLVLPHPSYSCGMYGYRSTATNETQDTTMHTVSVPLGDRAYDIHLEAGLLAWLVTLFFLIGKVVPVYWSLTKRSQVITPTKSYRALGCRQLP